ncbi:MAG: signal peptidase I [Nanoarchaeota archaeon]|nr:signal peptidase I [Nanoarchaeota archaeon]MBU1030269.1 signal peptidase I [Nanoarchaeota archaeon]MBU1850712.1 signal peptidase I [Nanoarchaeota archaeon]
MAGKQIKKPTTTLGKVWYFIWHDDSIASWLVNVVLAFVLIKFVVYPGLGLIFGTSFPVVAVVSNSMEHEGKFYDWWALHEDFYLKNNITDIDFLQYSFSNGFNKGDIMVLFGVKPENVQVGDVIVYRAKKPYPIIHRVVNIRRSGETFFETKGDNNPYPIRDFDLDEQNVLDSDLLGKAVFRIPFLGYIKIWFVDLMKLIHVYNIFIPS